MLYEGGKGEVEIKCFEGCFDCQLHALGGNFEVRQKNEKWIDPWGPYAELVQWKYHAERNASSMV
jgi:hypothetical protein